MNSFNWLSLGGGFVIQKAMKVALLFAFTAFGAVAHGEVFLEADFEGSSSLPVGWTESTISGGASWSVASGGAGGNPSGAQEGDNNARLFLGSTSDNITRLISPSFNTVGYINLSLDFWHTQVAWFGQYQDDLKVLYSIDGGSTWTVLVHYIDDVIEWTQRSLDIPVSSSNMMIAFEGNAQWGHGVCLDDIIVSGIPDTWSEVSVSVTDATASEVGPDSGTWTISRTGNTTGTLSVNYTLSGNATSGSDYTLNIPSTINFAAGETSKVVTLTPVDDTEGAEGDEVATLTLTAGTNYAIDSASGDISIYDDEGFELNILVIGSTHSFSEGGEHDVVDEKPFNPTAIAAHLEEILDQDTVLNKTTNVVFEDVFKTKTNEVRTSSSGINNITAHCYSLAQHFMWPDGKTTRLANLRSEAGTKWDYIVLCGDPYIMANFPGMYAEGVNLIQSEVAKTVVPEGEPSPEVVLLAQWPENSSTFSVSDFNEVVHRVGGSADLTVVPAGKVWDSYTSQDTDAAHPTPKGEYLAAASIYSKLYNRSASTSGYDYTPGGDAIADHALTEVQATVPASQYSGTYTDINPFQMKYVTKRDVNYRETGTSTEDRLALAMHRLDDVHRIRFIQNQGSFWDFNYGRGNDWWEDEKDYEVNPAKHDRAYGFPIHHYYTGSAANAAAQTMPYGIDKYYYGSTYEDGTDLGIAYNMIRPNTRELSLPEDVRAIPIRLLWLKMERAFPGFQPLGDNTHMGPYLNDASVAFMYTLLSGRCPVVEEPTPAGSAAWQQWLGHKIGYETAWQMSHLTTRAPGFRVLPSDVSTTAVTTQASETMTVRFTNPPEADVTVNVSVSNTGAATVSPSTLVFTPSNYNTPQEVTVTGKSITPASEEFEVVFATTSNDEVYDNLGDSWTYTTLNTNTVTDLIAGFDGNNTSTTSGSTKTLSDPHQSTAALFMGVDATLSTTDTMSKDFQWTAANQASLGTWGTVVLPPPPITYNTTTVATIAGPTTLQFTIDNSAGTQAIELETFHFSAQRDSGTTALQVTIAYAGGDLAGSSGIQSLVNDTGTNHGYDFDLTAILTNNVLAAGETATFTIAQTTSETSRLKLDDIAISGNVIPATPDETAPTPDPMTWASPPAALSDSSISMTAATAADPSGVEYFFDETSDNPGGSDSGWQNSPTYIDTGLNASTQYTYTVTARDKATTPNTTAASASASATTLAAPDPVSAGTSTVVASPASVPANNSTTSTITVTLRDAGGTPVSGKTVSLVGNASATIETANNISDAGGVVTFTVRSSSVGTETFSATGDAVAITQTAAVEFTSVVTPGVIGLLAGFDGYQTHQAISPANITSNSGVRQIISPLQDASMVGAVSGRIWTDQVTNKEFQWTGANQNSTTTGNWGLSDFDTNAQTGSANFVITQQLASWINFEITNTGSNAVILDKLHFAASRSNSSTAPTQVTVTLEQNGTYANPPVLSASPLTALTVGSANTINLNPSSTAWTGYELSLPTILSNYTLAAGETATFRIANNAGGARLYMDNFAISGSVSAPANIFDSWISGYEVGELTGFTDDFDKDGLGNGIENYFGTHPGEFTVGLLPSAVDIGADTFTFTHPISDEPASDITAAYRWSKNLTNFYYSGESDPAETTVTFTPGTPSGGIVTVTATLGGTPTDKVFVDIEVTQD